jgi:UDP-3-O-[3-hydroxymyristoyl] glucosamine N-acyltransferase
MIVILGFATASVTADYVGMFTQAGYAVKVLEPPKFLLGEYDPGDQYIISVTKELSLRKQLSAKLDEDNLTRATFVHESCWIDPTAVIGPGTFLSPFCTVASNARIGKDCLLAPYCLVGHISQLGDCCLLNPAVTIPGGCNVESGCKLNVRSTLIDYIHVASGSQIGAGALVTKNIDTPGFYVGTPARRVK